MITLGYSSTVLRSVGTFHSIGSRLICFSKGQGLTAHEMRTYFLKTWKMDVRPTEKKEALANPVSEDYFLRQQKDTSNEGEFLLTVYDRCRQEYVCPFLHISKKDAYILWSRHYEEWNVRTGGVLDFSRHWTILREYEMWKTRQDKMDYTDILLQVLEREVTHGASILMCDEAQDMNPLMVAVLKKFRGEPQVVQAYLAGDDHQTIYGFNGASADFLLTVEGEVRILPETHRHAQRVQTLLQAYSHRLKGQPKDVQSHIPGGEVQVIENKSVMAVLSQIEKERKTFLLARTNKWCHQIVRALEYQGIPYDVLGCPSVSEGVLGLVQTCREIQAQGQDARLPEGMTWHQFFHVMPRKYLAVMKKVFENDAKYFEQMPWWTCLKEGWESLDWECVFKELKNCGGAQLAKRKRELAVKFWRSGVTCVWWSVGTWHRSKGLECDQVVVFADSYDQFVEEDGLAERRALYVALSRGRRKVVVVSGAFCQSRLAKEVLQDARASAGVGR